jgi:hypothetical protein
MKIKSLIVCALILLPTLASAQTPRVLFYGNSFTIATGFGSSKSVDAMFRDVAIAAGNPIPLARSASAAGRSLEWHLANNTAAITNSIAPGLTWDYVVLQDFSTQPTMLGNLALHRSSYVELFSRVRQHSPNVKAIGYETWARAPGHSFYAGPNPSFPGGPAQMQAQLREGYNLSTADTNALFGPGTSVVAPVGDAWELAGFPTNYYASDLYHAANRGTLTAALLIYSKVYNDPTLDDINLSGVFANLGLSNADGMAVVLAASRVIPEPSTLGVVVMAWVAGLRRRRVTAAVS